MSVLFYNQLREWSDASRRRNVARFVFASADADAHCNSSTAMAASTTGLSSVARGMGRIVIDGGSTLLQKQKQMQTSEDISESEDDDGDGDDDGEDDGGDGEDDGGGEDEEDIERKIQMVARFLETNALHPDPDAEARRLYRLATHLQDDDEIQE